MKLFDATTKSTKYIPTILRIVILLALIVITFVLRFNIKLENEVLKIVSAITSVVVFLLLILCVYCEISRLIVISDNRKKISLDKNPPKASECTEMILEEVISLIENNDIIDIVLLADNKAVLLGSSSNTKNISSPFCDKRYYINDTTYQELNDFLFAVQALQANGKMLVYSIDGVNTRRDRRWCKNV